MEQDREHGRCAMSAAPAAAGRASFASLPAPVAVDLSWCVPRWAPFSPDLMPSRDGRLAASPTRRVCVLGVGKCRCRFRDASSEEMQAAGFRSTDYV
jgi:hypothetical protein